MYDHILVALDGSESSQYAGRAAMAIAGAMGCRVTACHVYGAEMHRRRFVDMEPGLPDRYQQQETLTQLRTAHDSLTYEGFKALSTGYIEDFVAECRDAGLKIDCAAVEGRSYVGILHLARSLKADLIAMGADGLGAIGDGMLGGTTTRVLNAAECDVLVARSNMTDGSVVAGIDGSEQAVAAAKVAAEIGKVLAKELNLVAAYDPDFHTRVFGTMARSLSQQRQDEVGLANQEQLHDDIINDGLGRLYREFLNDALTRLNGKGQRTKSHLVTGKAYCALKQQAEQLGADLVVVSRFGHHRESCSRMGSNAENLLRTTSANVLLVGGVGRDRGDDYEAAESAHATQADSPAALIWDIEAQSRLERVPSFVRTMARRTVEMTVRELGKARVSAEDFDSVAAKFGMGAPRGGNE